MCFKKIKKYMFDDTPLGFIFIFLAGVIGLALIITYLVEYTRGI